jgi:hypothetical protein
MLVNSLWVGTDLSDMERIAMTSHLKQGHAYRLWCYDDIEGVPDGVIIEDGNKVLPESDIFTYRVGEGRGSFSAFSNLFRYKMIADGHGWWVDTDVVALKPFNFQTAHVFASELTEDYRAHATTCVIKSTPEFGKSCYEWARGQNRDTLEWGVIGPTLLRHQIIKQRLGQFVRNPVDFCPLNWFDPLANEIQFESLNLDNSYAVHLWHEMWRRKNINKNGAFHEGTLYGRLKKIHLRSHPEDSRDQHRHGIRFL